MAAVGDKFLISQEDLAKEVEIQKRCSAKELREDEIDRALVIAQTINSQVSVHFMLSEIGGAYLRLSTERGCHKAYYVAKIKQELGDAPYELMKKILLRCLQIDSKESVDLAQKIHDENARAIFTAQYRNELYAAQAKMEFRLLKESIFQSIEAGDAQSLRWTLVLLKVEERSKYFSATQKFLSAWTGGGEEELTPLQLASKLGNKEIVSCLIDCGAPVNDMKKTSASTERSSLHVALDAGQTHIASLLISKGAKDTLASCSNRHGLRKYHFLNPPKEDRVYLSALHMAIINNWHLIAKEFLTLNATDVTLQATGGNSSLHLAARIGDEGMVRMLLSFGAKTCLNLQNNEGDTPKDIALKMGREYLAPLLS